MRLIVHGERVPFQESGDSPAQEVIRKSFRTEKHEAFKLRLGFGVLLLEGGHRMQEVAEGLRRTSGSTFSHAVKMP